MKNTTTAPFTLTLDQRIKAGRYLARHKARFEKIDPANKDFKAACRLRIEALERGLEKVDAYTCGQSVTFYIDDYHYVMVAAEIG